MDWMGFLKVMVIEEKAAWEKYQVAAEMADDPKVRELMEKLRDEEEYHVRFLEGEYARLEKAAKR